MMIQKNRYNFLLFFSLFFVMKASFSVPSVKESPPVLIDSDSAQMNYKMGVNIYQGNVHVVHGHSQLAGDTMTTYRNREHKIHKVITLGSPATLYSEENQDESPLNAKADKITYYPLQHMMVLKGHAYATQEKNVITAPLLRYNTFTKTLKAKSTQEMPTHILIDDAGATTTNGTQ